MDWLLKHKIAAIIVIALVTGLAWYMLSGSSSPDAVLATQDVQQVPPEAQDLLNSLLALQAVTLSSQIFTNPSFIALKDFSTPITPEPVGRSNPFTPFEGTSRSTTAPADGTP